MGQLMWCWVRGESNGPSKDKYCCAVNGQTKLSTFDIYVNQFKAAFQYLTYLVLMAVLKTTETILMEWL